MSQDEAQALLEATHRTRGVVESALRADVEQIRAHVRLALDEGATAREILEALEAVIAPMGALAFRRGIQAWSAEVEARGTRGGKER